MAVGNFQQPFVFYGVLRIGVYAALFGRTCKGTLPMDRAEVGIEKRVAYCGCHAPAEKNGLCGEALHPMGWRSKSDAFLPAWNLKMHKGISHPDYGKPHAGAKRCGRQKMRRKAPRPYGSA